MSLEDLLEQLERTRTQRFVSRSTITAQLESLAQQLEVYAGSALRTDAIRKLDAFSLALKKQRRSELSDVIQSVDAVREPYRPQQETVAYSLISTNFARYDVRIQEVNQFLDDNYTSYDDLALTKDWLQNNAYLKRKRKTNAAFDHKARLLEKRLEKRMHAYAPPQKVSQTPYARAKATLARAAIGLSGALLTLSSLPTAWYAPFYQ